MEVPILAFSGMINNAAGRIAALGFDDLLSKPVEFSTLSQAIRRHLSPPPSGAPFGNARRVVVCNDNAVQLKVTRLQLTRLGFQVSTTADGVDALEMAKTLHPVALVADMVLQRLDGLALCRTIRQDPDLQGLAVVLVTSHYLHDSDRQTALRAGANAYVSRTTNRAEIIEALRSALGEEKHFVAAVTETAPVVEEQRHRQLLGQLERQVSINIGLAQRCSMLATKFSVLSAVSTALVQSKDAMEALSEVLATCLDTIGATHGAIYVRAADDSFSVHAGIGFAPRPALLLANLFGHAEVLERAFSSSVAVDIDAATVGERAASDVGQAVDGGFALLAPLIRDGTHLGVLLVAGRSEEVATEDWRSFADAIAAQIATSLLLTRYLAQAAASENRYRTLLESASDAIFVTAHDSGVLLQVNAAGEQLLGRPRAAIIGRHFLDFLSEPVVATASPSGTVKALRPDGSTVPVEYSSAAMEIDGRRVAVAIVRDVSAREAVAEQLRLAQRLEAIGRFSGGVAHDFNNLLTVVLSCSEFLLEGSCDVNEQHEELLEIKKAGERAAALIRQLLAFSRRQVLDPRVLDLNELIDNMGKMLRRVIGEDIDLQIQLCAARSPVRADSGQLEQVVMNLAVNARDAMPHGGKLVIDVSNVDLDEAYGERYGQSRVGPHTLLSVRDTGEGMSADTLSRIFEPFFTTKEQGRGTGLGLATVYGIVKQSGGDIWVESKVGEGAVFKIYLPVSTAEIERAHAASPRSSNCGHERILLVEDDEAVRLLARKILTGKGYAMSQASSGEGGLAELGRCDGAVDLLITDMVMTGMSGAQMVTLARKILPRLKVLFMSGYLDRGALPAELESPSGVYFLQKPFTPETISRKVREVLDSA